MKIYYKKLSPNDNESVMYESTNNRTPIVGLSNCGKPILLSDILSRKQGEKYVIRKSVNQYPQRCKNISDKIQPLNEHENSTVVSDDKFLSKQESKINLFFAKGRHNNIDICNISQN